MGLFDKIRSYLNEEDPADTNEYKTEPEEAGEKKPGNRKRTGRKKSDSAGRRQDSLDDEINTTGARNVVENERKTVQDFCEQLVDVASHMEEARREYQIVTEYLTDIQRIEELPIDMANTLIDTAGKIARLDKDRQTYIQSENLLPTEQYNILAHYSGEVTDTIRNLNEMEMRDSMLKSDMGHLEGEKEDLKYMRVEYADRAERLRGVIITILILLLLSSGIVFAYALATKQSVTLYALMLGTAAMLAFVIFYLKYTDYRNEIKNIDAKVNRAISLLNKVKVKFINNTNALDYIYEKYDVNSSKELEYRWEQYNTMVRDEKKYYQTNSELRMYHDELVTFLTRIGVRDPNVWIKQVDAIIDRREMVEIKHGLNQRRKHLRERMATCEKIRDNACTALRAAVADNPGMESYIVELLAPYKIKIDN